MREESIQKFKNVIAARKADPNLSLDEAVKSEKMGMETFRKVRKHLGVNSVGELKGKRKYGKRKQGQTKFIDLPQSVSLDEQTGRVTVIVCTPAQLKSVIGAT